MTTTPPQSSSSRVAAVPVSPLHRAISPPTPAPSPQPSSLGRLLPSGLTDGPSLSKYIANIFSALPSTERLGVLSDLLGLCTIRELAQLQSDIAPRLKVDFLSCLPIEVSLHILGFIDDPRTLARASCVSRFWRSLVNDEHTWKAMCAKHAFRYRRASLTALGVTPFYQPSPFPSSLSVANEAYGNSTQSHSSSNNTRLATLSETYDADDVSETTDDATLLASLYQRYRSRGLDPSNALHELRTLHDLFLAKQEGADVLGVVGSGGDMSDADQAFYEQLEEIVAEESQERYGDDGLDSDAARETWQEDGMPDGEDIAHLGWLSAGPSSRTPLVGGSSSTQRTPRQGMMATGALGALTSPASRRADLPHVSSSSPMDLDDEPASSGLGLPFVGGNGAKPSASYSAMLSRRYGLANSKAALLEDTGEAQSSHHALDAGEDTGSSSAAAAANSKKVRRRSAPGGPGRAGKAPASLKFGLGRPPPHAGMGERAVTFAEGSTRVTPPRRHFSYKTHFKLAYLTESNWRRGGRLLTQYTSSDNGAVVTSLAIDAQYIVVGMANSRIHVFDARTGLYVRTLVGHESGVWAMALISKTPGAKAASKGKAREDRYTAPLSRGSIREVDLELLVHDARPSASAFAEAEAVPEWPNSSGSVSSSPGSSAYMSTFGSSSAGLMPPRTQSATALHEGSVGQSEDETLEWFHRARKAMLRKTTSSSSLRTGSGSSGSARRGATSAAEAQAEVDAGSFRDAVMADGTGHVPSALADQIRATRASMFPDEDAEATAAAARAAAEAEADAIWEDQTSPQPPPRLSPSDPAGCARGYGNDDAIVVTGGCDRDIRVWNLRTGECKFVMVGHTSTVRCLKIIEGRPLAVSGSRDGTLRVWNVATGQLVHLLAGHQHSVRCVEVAGNYIASGSYDCTCRLWDVDSGECISVLEGHFHQIYAVAFDGKRVATGSLDSTVRIWDAATSQCLCVLQGHTSLVGQLQMTDTTLVTGGSDGRVIVFCLKTFKTKMRLCAHDNSVVSLQFNDRYIVTGGNDGRVKLWDMQTGALIREMVEPAEQIWKTSFNEDQCVVLCKRAGRTSMEVLSFSPVVEDASGH